MTKKEIYAWTSLASSLAILGYYLITVFGWPQSIPDVTENLKSLFIRVFLIALVVETGLDILRSINKEKVFADERDQLIEAKGTKYSYYFLTGAVFVIAGQELLNDFFARFVSPGFEHIPFLTVHLLLATAFLGIIIKSGTQLFYYMKG